MLEIYAQTRLIFAWVNNRKSICLLCWRIIWKSNNTFTYWTLWLVTLCYVGVVEAWQLVLINYKKQITSHFRTTIITKRLWCYMNNSSISYRRPTLSYPQCNQQRKQIMTRACRNSEKDHIDPKWKAVTKDIEPRPSCIFLKRLPVHLLEQFRGLTHSWSAVHKENNPRLQECQQWFIRHCKPRQYGSIQH